MDDLSTLPPLLTPLCNCSQNVSMRGWSRALLNSESQSFHNRNDVRELYDKCDVQTEKINHWWLYAAKIPAQNITIMQLKYELLVRPKVEVTKIRPMEFSKFPNVTYSYLDTVLPLRKGVQGPIAIPLITYYPSNYW